MSETGQRRWLSKLVWIATYLLLIGVSASHIRVLFKNRRQAAEIVHLAEQAKQLKQELGFIHVTDARSAYVMPLASKKRLTWKYRVYFPAKQKFHLGVSQDWTSIGLPGADSSMGPVPMDGQFTVVISIREGGDGVWRLYVSMPRSTHVSQFKPNRTTWLADGDDAIPFVARSENGPARKLGSKQPIPMLSFRGDLNAAQSPGVRDDGITVWFDPRAGIAMTRPTKLPLPDGDDPG